MQACKQASRQAGKHASMQACKHASRQACKQASMQAGVGRSYRGGGHVVLEEVDIFEIVHIKEVAPTCPCEYPCETEPCEAEPFKYPCETEPCEAEPFKYPCETEPCEAEPFKDPCEAEPCQYPRPHTRQTHAQGLEHGGLVSAQHEKYQAGTVPSIHGLRRWTYEREGMRHATGSLGVGTPPLRVYSGRVSGKRV